MQAVLACQISVALSGPQQNHEERIPTLGNGRASISFTLYGPKTLCAGREFAAAGRGWAGGRLHEYFIPVVANHLGPFESLTPAAAAGREQRGMALIVHRLIGFCK